MIRKYFTGFLVLLFVLIFIPFSIGFGFLKTFFNEDFYKGDFVDILYEVMVSDMPAGIEWKDTLRGFDRDAFEDILRDVYQPEDISNAISQFSEQLKATPSEGGNTIKIDIPMSFILDKSDLVVEKVIDLVIDEVEQCESIEQYTPNSPNCIPEGYIISEYRDVLAYDITQRIYNNVPQSFSFEVSVPENFEFENFSEFVVSVLKTALFIAFFAMLTILVIIGFLVFKPLSKVLKVEANAVFTASILPLVSFILGYIFAERLTLLGDKGYLVFSSFLLKAFSGEMIYYLAPIAIVSFVLYIVGYILTKKHESK